MRKPLHVRCFAKVQDGQWVALCVDFSLAAQGDSFEDVKSKLDAQIVEYVNDALTVDRAYASQLLTRRAPLRYLVEYQLCRAYNKLLRMVAPKHATPERLHAAVYDDVVPRLLAA